MCIILLCCEHMHCATAGIHIVNALGHRLNCSTAPSGGLKLEQGFSNASFGVTYTVSLSST